MLFLIANSPLSVRYVIDVPKKELTKGKLDVIVESLLTFGILSLIHTHFDRGGKVVIWTCTHNPTKPTSLFSTTGVSL